LDTLLNARLHAGHAVKHPERNFPLEVPYNSVENALILSDVHLLYDITDPGKAASPRMPSINCSAGDGPVSALALGCTIPSDPTRAVA